MKTCYRCKAVKTLSEFGSCARFKDGLRKECKACGRADALAYRNAHLEQQRQSKRNWAANNPERVLEYSRLYHRANRNDILPKAVERQRRYASEHPGAVKATHSKSSRKWRKANAHIINAKTAMRKASKIMATVAWANMFLVGEAYHLAKLRTVATGIEWHVDHTVPLNGATVCGLHVEDNLQVISALANVKKQNRHWPNMPEAAAAT